MGHPTHIEKIKRIVDGIVRAEFNEAIIHSVIVEQIDYADDEDEITLHVTVVFENQGRLLDPSKTAGLVRHVRPRLQEAGERMFPLFSFVKKSDARGMLAEGA